MKRAATLIITAVALALATAGAASASSIVYIKNGDIWLTSPDGSKSYQVTFDGHYFSPSQADNGMIVAGHGSTIVRMDRSGHLLGAPVPVVGGDTTTWPPSPRDKFYGPMDPKVSPDGKQVAYWFYEYENYYSAACSCVQYWLQNYTTSTAVDHLTSTPQDIVREDRDPSWIDNNHTLVWDPYFTYQASTWVPGGDYNNRQWWFQHPDAMIRDGELSPDRTKLATIGATGGAGSPYDHVYLWSMNGPAWVGDPPYHEDINNDPEVPAPTLQCQNVRDSDASSPTWSPDSSAIAYHDKDGIWVQQIPAELSDCTVHERLLVAGGSDPDWGPADVDMAQKLASPGTGGPPSPGSQPSTQGGGSVSLSGLSVTPRRFRVLRHGHGGAVVRFRLTGAARVTLIIARGKSGVGQIVLSGHSGVNAVRITGKVGNRSLARGRYQLLVAAGRSTARTGFEVTR
jgi:hypothetical protein